MVPTASALRDGLDNFPLPLCVFFLTWRFPFLSVVVVLRDRFSPARLAIFLPTRQRPFHAQFPSPSFWAGDLFSAAGRGFIV